MNNLTIARRYARALHEEAAHVQQVEPVDADMALIGEALGSSRELVQFFESPVIPREKKEAVVQALFAERVQPTTLHFLRLLIEKKREALFPDVVEAYRDLRDAQQGIVEANARVAFPMSDEEQAHLVAALERLSGARVRLQVAQDPALLGGLVVRLGDTVYDGSVRHQLSSLRERMETGTLPLN